jgi:hypothetical protein
MAVRDKELEAISSIIDLLKPLDATQRSRVLEYVLKRLEMGAVPATSTVDPEIGFSSLTSATPTIKDIRTLTAEKQPRSASEMVAVIAYYLSELAPESERSDIVNADRLRRYFKAAAFPLPRKPEYTLPNAAAAGYLDNVSRGEYRLNPVGYNLVVHGLPRSSATSPSGVVRRPVRRKTPPSVARPAKRKSSRN